MKNIRKFIVFATTLAMVFAMSAVSFAADNPTSNGTITIEKNLKVTNPTLTSVDGPGASFAYAIAPVAPAADNGGTTITDAQNHTGAVHQGPADGVTLTGSPITYPIGTAVNASASGADNIKSITATADITKFSAPGIYRYQLTETATLGDCGATNTDGTRYIDVYVVNGTNGLEFSGLVMHDGSTAEGKPAQKKTLDNATFETVNVTLQKTVSGNMADKNHEFPFAGTVADHGRYFYAKENAAPTAVDADKQAGVAAGSPISVNLKDTEKFYIYGVSKTATVAYTETNNTQDTYQTSITGGTASAASAVAPNGTKEMAATDVDDAAAVVFNNDLEAVSPTGVVMRYGMYIGLIAMAGILLFMRKKAKN